MATDLCTVIYQKQITMVDRQVQTDTIPMLSFLLRLVLQPMELQGIAGVIEVLAATACTAVTRLIRIEVPEEDIVTSITAVVVAPGILLRQLWPPPQEALLRTNMQRRRSAKGQKKSDEVSNHYRHPSLKILNDFSVYGP